MVYTGKPSAGCENCRYVERVTSSLLLLTLPRKAKKRCDQALPACERCIRLGKACGGYRDLNDLIFKNETASVARRASSQSETSQSGTTSSSGTRQPSPEKETMAKKFFFSQFVTASHLSFLDGVSPDNFLMKPIMACAVGAMANRENDARKREQARGYYIEAITATNAALRHPRKVKEDNTIVAVSLLSVFEVFGCHCPISVLYTNVILAYILGAKHVGHIMATSCSRLRPSVATTREEPDQNQDRRLAL
jgi:hypothetical protein